MGFKLPDLPRNVIGFSIRNRIELFGLNCATIQLSKAIVSVSATGSNCLERRKRQGEDAQSSFSIRNRIELFGTGDDIKALFDKLFQYPQPDRIVWARWAVSANNGIGGFSIRNRIELFGLWP